MGSGITKFHVDYYGDYFEITFEAVQQTAKVSSAAVRASLLEALAKVPDEKLSKVRQFRVGFMSK